VKSRRSNTLRWIFPLATLAAAGCSSSSPNGGVTAPADGGSRPTGDGGSSTTGDGGSSATGSDGGGESSSSGGDGATTITPPPAPDASTGGGPGLLTCTDSSAVTTGNTGSSPGPGVLAGMTPGPGHFVGGCQIFPADNAWNVNVSSPSLKTTTVYSGLPLGTHLHPDLGGWSPPNGPYGIPINVVATSQAAAQITFNQYATESDPGPGGWTSDPNKSSSGIGVTAYPIANGAHIEGNPAMGQTPGDDHLLVIQQGATCGAPCTLWETWATVGGSSAPWTAANGAKWSLGSNELRTAGWTSADAAGLSVLAGLVRISEVKAGVVTHAIRVTFNNTQKGYVYPATHFAGSSPLGGSDPPMGLRLRLKATFDTSKFSGPGKIVATAMQTYGLIIADIGSDWFFQGDSDDGWNDMDQTDTFVGELLKDFGGVTGQDFDVLDPGMAPSNAGG
jgi:hypothetical protein